MGAHRQTQRSVQVLAEARAAQQQEHLNDQAEALAQLDCLRHLSDTALKRLATACTLRAFTAGTSIINERAASNFLYIVLRGSITLLLHDRAEHEVLIGVLNRGDCFGEGPLFGDLFRGATVHAETTCYLLQLPLDDVRALLPEAPELARNLRHEYSRRLVESSLGRVPLFSQLSPFERARIATLLAPRVCRRGEIIIREGEPGDALYLIETGQVAVEQNGQVIAHLQEGDFFGEMSLLTNSPHNADIRALTPVEVLALPASAFKMLLAQQPLLAKHLQDVVATRRAASVDRQNNPVRVQQFGAVVEHGLLRGTHLLVRDEHLCVEGCTLCETACETRHGRARLRVNGVVVDGLNVADTCRQCRFGAECVEACPEDALTWNERGALVVNDRCTGCGACVPACPYDAMRLVALPGEAHGPLWSLWRQLRHMRHPTIPLEPAKPTHRADKCDLCHGYDDFACVRVCPTGALRLVPVEELFPL